MSRSRDIADAGVKVNYLDNVGADINTTYSTLASPTFTGTTDISSGVTLPSNPTVTLGSNATFPAGHVIQTTNTTYNANSSDTTTSTTMSRVVESGSYHWTGQITGVLASSWVSITMSFNGESFKNASANAGVGYGIFRESTLIMDAKTHALYIYVGTTTYADIYCPITLTFVDKTPATGTNNYYLGYKAHSTATNTVQSSSTYQPFVCTLQEIAQ